MNKNPENLYREFLLNFKNKSPEKIIYMGVILQLNPIEVKTNELELYSHNLLVAESFNNKIKKRGDRVVLLKIEGQDQFLILDKVVQSE